MSVRVNLAAETIILGHLDQTLEKIERLPRLLKSVGKRRIFDIVSAQFTRRSRHTGDYNAVVFFFSRNRYIVELSGGLQ